MGWGTVVVLSDDIDRLANTVRAYGGGTPGTISADWWAPFYEALDALAERAKQALAEVERMAMDMYENAVPKDEANRVIAENQEQMRAWGREFLDRAEAAEAEVERLTRKLDTIAGVGCPDCSGFAREALAGKEHT